MRKVLLLIMTTALVVAAGMSGTASALSFTATSLVQEENASCGKFIEGGGPIIGSAKFTRTGNLLTVTYKAKHLAKATEYVLEFLTANGCEFLGTPAFFFTTATGVGKVTASMEVPEKDFEFFVDADTSIAPPFSNDSFIVTLPKP